MMGLGLGLGLGDASSLCGACKLMRGMDRPEYTICAPPPIEEQPCT